MDLLYYLNLNFEDIQHLFFICYESSEASANAFPSLGVITCLILLFLYSNSFEKSDKRLSGTPVKKSILFLIKLSNKLFFSKSSCSWH